MTSRLMKGLLIGCGTVCVALGIIGIFLPLMPTTVFLLMAAACYARSSERFHRKLLEHPVLGPYIRHRRGLSSRQKALILTMLWVSLGATMLWTARAPWLRGLLIVIGAGVTLHVARLPSLPRVASLDPDPIRPE